MTTTVEGLKQDAPAEDPELRPIPNGWLAVGHIYPRIGVTAPTRDAALDLFERHRAAWLSAVDDSGAPAE